MTIRYGFFVRPPFLYRPVRIPLGIPLIIVTLIRVYDVFFSYRSVISYFAFRYSPNLLLFTKSFPLTPESTPYTYVNTRVRVHCTRSSARLRGHFVIVIKHCTRMESRCVYTRGQVLFFNACAYCYGAAWRFRIVRRRRAPGDTAKSVFRTARAAKRRVRGRCMRRR